VGITKTNCSIFFIRTESNIRKKYRKANVNVNLPVASRNRSTLTGNVRLTLEFSSFCKLRSGCLYPFPTAQLARNRNSGAQYKVNHHGSDLVTVLLGVTANCYDGFCLGHCKKRPLPQYQYAAKDIHKEMLPMGSISLWISYVASIFFAHKKRTTPRCSIVAHVFRGAAIL
jgi:hypothetical protein